MSINILLPNIYPEKLNEIPDPPKELYLRGELPPIDSLFLTVVGSRKCTSYGKEACEHIIGGLRGYPIVIVSGLALGIDAIAHEAALRSELTTIAIPGSGLDPSVLYPASNRGLAEQIVKNGGALLSEFEPAQRATPYTFPQRNRLMAGIARGVLVIEAEERSGTLITSRLATEYNRDVFAVSGSIFSRGNTGVHMLLKLGATPVASADDILEQWGIEKNEDTHFYCNDSLTGQEKNILELLAEPKSKDNLVRTLQIPTSEALILLSSMEIKGLIKESTGLIRRT